MLHFCNLGNSSIKLNNFTARVVLKKQRCKQYERYNIRHNNFTFIYLFQPTSYYTHARIIFIAVGAFHLYVSGNTIFDYIHPGLVQELSCSSPAQ